MSWSSVASRTLEAASVFAAEFAISRAHGSYEALLADPEVEVVYIATPHPWHAHWSVLAARAKKHVLCEKPLGMNHAEVNAIVQAARENDVIFDGSVHVPLPSADSGGGAAAARWRAGSREGDSSVVLHRWRVPG
ncbi:MAG: Gfo/Idh/MocA family oxidoreductase [Pseudomonadota bacterium]